MDILTNIVWFQKFNTHNLTGQFSEIPTMLLFMIFTFREWMQLGFSNINIILYTKAN